MPGIDIAINTLPFIEIVKRVLFGLSFFLANYTLHIMKKNKIENKGEYSWRQILMQ